MLELSVYNDIAHLLTPVVTEPKKAIIALKWVCKEMERRYSLMNEEGTRSLEVIDAIQRAAITHGLVHLDASQEMSEISVEITE